MVEEDATDSDIDELDLSTYIMTYRPHLEVTEEEEDDVISAYIPSPPPIVFPYRPPNRDYDSDDDKELEARLAALK